MIVDSEEEEAEPDADSGPYHKNYVTTRYMTKYEKARILGTRALQIRFGKISMSGVHYPYYIIMVSTTYSHNSAPLLPLPEQHGRTPHGRPRRGNGPIKNC